MTFSALSLLLGCLGSFVASLKDIMNGCLLPIILLSELDYLISAKGAILSAPKAFS
jgi:hypothetical protein